MADEKAKTIELVVRLPPDLHAAVKARAENDERSIAATVRYALRLYLNGGKEPTDG